MHAQDTTSKVRFSSRRGFNWWVDFSPSRLDNDMRRVDQGDVLPLSSRFRMAMATGWDGLVGDGICVGALTDNPGSGQVECNYYDQAG